VTIRDWLIARQLTQLADYRVVDSTVYACIDARCKVSRRRTSDADDRLRGDIKMQEIRPGMLYQYANSVKAERPSIHSRARYRPAV